MEADLGPATLTIISSLCLGVLAIILSDLLRFPSIAICLVFGLLFGSKGLGAVAPDALGGGLGVLVTIFVGIIIFEGAFSLKVKGIMKVRKALGLHLALSSVLAFATAFACSTFLLGLSLESALVVSALSIVTGPTVIKPILRHLSLRGDVKNFLLGEGIAIDLVGAVLTIVIVDYLVTRETVGAAFASLGLLLAAGSLTGLAVGLATHAAYRKFPATIGKVRVYVFLFAFFAAFLAAERIRAESGLIAVAVLGFVFSRLDSGIKEEVLSFKEKMTRILISMLFILLSARIDVSTALGMLGPGLATIGALIAARFVAVMAGGARGAFSLGEKAFIAWLSPRGVVAISVASIAAIKLRAAGVADAGSIEAFAFMLVLATVTLGSATAGPLARAARIERKGSGNLLVLGVNQYTLAIARAWRERGLGVLFVDSDPKKAAGLEREGFPCVNGNGVDPSVLEGGDFDIYETAIAATSNYELNILFCQMVRRHCGIESVVTFADEGSLDELGPMLRSNGIAYNVLPAKEGQKSLLGAIRRIIFPQKIESRIIEVAEDDREGIAGNRRIVKLALIRGESLMVYSEGQEILARDKALVAES